MAPGLHITLQTHHGCLNRLAEDHVRAQRLADALRALPEHVVERIAPVATNIVVWVVAQGAFGAAEPVSVAVAHFERFESGVKISSMGGRALRFVTHLDVGDQDLELAVRAIQALPQAAVPQLTQQ